MTEEKRLRSVEICDRPLMCEDEWKDKEGVKVLGEYHKDEARVEEARIEEDLDAFERYWAKKEGINFQTEYHKKGAPYLEEPWGFDGHQPRPSGMASTGAPPEAPGRYLVYEEEGEAPAPKPVAKEMEEMKPVMRPPAPAKEAKERPKEDTKEKGKKQSIPISDFLDLNTLEVLSYWFFRLAFGRQLHVPFKREGVADMDLHVNNKDVVVNTNQLYFAFPELVVWHITYTHKGRPVLEIGRGVKNGMRIHRMNALRLGMEVWMGSRRSNRQKAAMSAQPIPAPKKVDLEDKGDIT